MIASRRGEPEDAVSFARRIADSLATVPGVEAVVLGGSQARGTARPDSDLDIALYYHPLQPLDTAALQTLATELDDSHRTGTVTEPGQWGPWVNGGAWLTIEGRHVDWLYRDIERVSSVIEDCREGRITADYYLGHPHAFHNFMYLGEIATCVPLHDPGNVIGALKALVSQYPPKLKEAIIGRYLYEARFMLEVSRAPVQREDVFASSGFFFRVVAALVQVLYALNEQWFLNEKGALERIHDMEHRPARFVPTARRVLARPGSTKPQLVASLTALERILLSVERLVRRTVGSMAWQDGRWRLPV